MDTPLNQLKPKSLRGWLGTTKYSASFGLGDNASVPPPIPEEHAYGAGGYPAKSFTGRPRAQAAPKARSVGAFAVVASLKDTFLWLASRCVSFQIALAEAGGGG